MPETKTITYEVSKGETLYSIAKKFFLDVKYLANINNLPTNYILSEGVIITIKYNTEFEDKISFYDPSRMPSFCGSFSVEHVRSMGWSNVHEEDLGLLNRFAKFTTEEARVFMALTTFFSNFGNQTSEYNEDEPVKYGPTGFMNLVGEGNYTAFAGYIGDKKIITLGQQYVGEKYPWVSAAYVWHKIIKPSLGQDPTLEEILKLAQGSTFGFNAFKIYYNLAKEVVRAA